VADTVNVLFVPALPDLVELWGPAGDAPRRGNVMPVGGAAWARTIVTGTAFAPGRRQTGGRAAEPLERRRHTSLDRGMSHEDMINPLT
jgi:hypothetical protein